MFAHHPETPDLVYNLVGTITKLIHVLISIPGSPKEALQSTLPYQCCIQAQLYSSIATKCL